MRAYLSIRDSGASDIGKMMGQHEGQKELFSYGVDLDRRVRSDHPLGRVQAMVDFTFARAGAAHPCGDHGNVSVDPVVLLKLMFLLFHENVCSERELVRRLPERLNWLGFLGYSLDDEAPHHSVLSIGPGPLGRRSVRGSVCAHGAAVLRGRAG